MDKITLKNSEQIDEIVADWIKQSGVYSSTVVNTDGGGYEMVELTVYTRQKTLRSNTKRLKIKR